MLGLTSLSGVESRTLQTIDSVLTSLMRISGQEDALNYPTEEDFFSGINKLKKNSEILFGKKPYHRDTSIMVTLSADMNYEDIYELISRGMDIARINLAKDELSDWTNLVSYLRMAEKELNKSCKLITDISGPKIRISWIKSEISDHRLKVGDIVYLSKEENPIYSVENGICIGINIPKILDNLKVSEKVLFDDGSIEAEITDIKDGLIEISVNKVLKKSGVKIKLNKGINFPDSDIKLDILTEKDLEDLDFVVQYADLVALSFVKNKEDIVYAYDILEEKMQKAGRQVNILAKIETARAVKNFAEIILEAASKRPFGVMLARGDLAVELGYLRFAELQQEILWICESADIPVVWATQVLESMTKTGIPSRAEVTDAAEGGARAECVMLNKGDNIFETVSFLDKILENMQSNFYKKTTKFRALKLAKNTFLNK